MTVASDSPDLEHTHSDPTAYRKQGRDHYREGQYDAALPCFNAALELCDDSNTRIERGKTLIALKQYDLALQDLQHARELSGNTAQISRNIALIYHKLQDLGQALAYYMRAFSEEPSNQILLGNMSRMMLSDGINNLPLETSEGGKYFLWLKKPDASGTPTVCQLEMEVQTSNAQPLGPQ